MLACSPPGSWASPRSRSWSPRGWTEAQKGAYVLADNQLAITGSGWDPELLRLELGELNLAGFDLSPGGGGAALTPFGDEVLERFQRVAKLAAEMAADDMAALARRVRPDAGPKV